MDANVLKKPDIEVAWLPSMPLINKRRAPSVAGVGILYSEETDMIFDVFETSNLVQTLATSMRRQSRALARDPNCRICWFEEADKEARESLCSVLSERVDKALFNVSE